MQPRDLATEIDPSRWISLAEEDFEPEITEFGQRVEASDNSTAVSKMLREAARRVTERAPAELDVADGFVAFAIDWELEGDELAKILQRGDKDGAVMSSYQAASSTCFRFFQPSRNKDASVNLFSKLCT